MPIELSKQYNPKEIEDKWYKFWQDAGLFSAKANSARKPFSIVIPPPNVTGILHMGHALNNTIQDILIRHYKMRNFETLWMPGTDHAGIATQNVVEKSLAKKGLKRHDLGREEFIKKVWEWREEHGETIIRQLKKIGSACDWDRERFTMDEAYTEAVKETFIALWKKDLIYQDNKVINWCPRCQTALSDEEAPHHEINGALYYIKYPVKVSAKYDRRTTAACRQDREYVVVATTRPETMLGDTAVAVNPGDKRYKKLIGKKLILPLVGREIEIISDPMVDMEFGTGAVKVTPAHDPNDYLAGKKHNLEFINIMTPDGRINNEAQDYEGLDRFEAREVIIEDLKERKLLEKVEAHQLAAGHCYRCHTIIEPRLSMQWFVRMKPLAKPAIEAVKEGKIKFYPERWTKVYLRWMESIQDWCISRQIWWGHRIPVYYCKKCPETGIQKSKFKNQNSKIKEQAFVSDIKPEKCPQCGSKDIHQDEDVLDTWFSSWLWPFAVFGWPFTSQNYGPQSIDKEQSANKRDLQYFYPTSVLVTAPEIIFFWVARMIMAGLEFMGEVPFKDVYIHGTVRDAEGKKMSKSLGNTIDPLEIINEYGADALRFSLISITSQGQDVYLTKDRFEQGRNFANKIWNASRFILMNLDTENAQIDLCRILKEGELNIANRWILSRFYSVLKEGTADIEDYKFNEAASLLHRFFRHEFCDWYLEMIKPDIKNRQNQVVVYKILKEFLRFLHPFMPFITEELWQRLPLRSEGLIMKAGLPHIQKETIDLKLEENLNLIFEIITLIRNMRIELGIALNERIPLKICEADENKEALLEEMSSHIQSLAKAGKLTLERRCVQQKGEWTAVAGNMHIVIPLAGIADIQELKSKTAKRMEEAEKAIRNKERTLSNDDFIRKAPGQIVEQEKLKLKELRETMKKLKVVQNGLR